MNFDLEPNKLYVHCITSLALSQLVLKIHSKSKEKFSSYYTKASQSWLNKKRTTKKWVNKNGNFSTMNKINAKKFGRIHWILDELKNVHIEQRTKV